MYEFLSGPMFVISLAVFFIGMTWRVIWYIKGLDWKLDRVAYKADFSHGIKGGIHSALKWMLPFGTQGWRSQPLFTVAFFMFHTGAILLPFFLIGHSELLRANFGFGLPTLPQNVSDILTICAIIGAVLLGIRRIITPSVRYLTTGYDWFILALATAPIVSGYLIAASPENTNFWLILHIILGELMLILAPFTKLSHIVLYFMSRIQIGMDYSIKRGGHKRGAYFPW
ncbi:sulfate respiration complex protein HmcE [Desulfovibrio litoralis]|uniref:Nitrate reductase gamma subunit n=1 Tax=Desulfovibrio litoralis DSM 11393 TaxID=1121455 RepID=A0A1M7TQF2_9BACT|nr:hypothetical protein [Desulfovibrio litoralis]SHN72930.1 Nitrate reductase gamma subunit [Desulfovibrio litoralis DSM 11393]